MQMAARSAGADALFGADAREATDDGGALFVLGTTNLAALDAGAAYAFDVLLNDVGVTVEIAADAGRGDLLGAVQEALGATAVRGSARWQCASRPGCVARDPLLGHRASRAIS